MVDTARRVGMALIGLAAIAVWFLMAPAPLDEESAQFNLSARNYADLVTQALDEFDANAALTESAPQQQVVNGWVARDLLSIIALAQADTLETLGGVAGQNEVVVSAVSARDDRVPALLTLLVVAVCWWAFTTSDVRIAGDTSSPSSGRHRMEETASVPPGTDLGGIEGRELPAEPDGR